MPSPTQRSLKLMRERGYLCAVVERYNPWSRTRADLFGFGDLLCVREGEIVILQTTSGSNLSKRIDKIVNHENVNAVRESGMTIIVHGWRKLKSGWACNEKVVE